MGFLTLFSDCITKAAEELGYPSTKQEQLDVHVAI